MTLREYLWSNPNDYFIRYKNYYLNKNALIYRKKTNGKNRSPYTSSSSGNSSSLLGSRASIL